MWLGGEDRDNEHRLWTVMENEYAQKQSSLIYSASSVLDQIRKGEVN